MTQPTQPMSRNRRNAAIAVAALVVLTALVLRFETARHEITGEASSCSISKKFDCDAVQASGYGRIAGVSLSVWAAAGHLILIGWLLAGRTLLAGMLALFNLILALALIYVTVFLIGSFCLYCTAMQLAIFVLAILILPPARRATTTTDRRGGLALPGLLAALFLGLALTGDAYATRRSAYLHLFQPGETVQERVDIAYAPILGDPETPISVLMFLDFGCQHCQGCFQTAKELVKKHPGCVHFVVKHYPLDRCNDHEQNKEFHPGACDAAWAAAAAGRVGQGPAALHYLFGQDSFYPQVLETLGERIGVSAQQWRRDHAGERAKVIVRRDMDDGQRLKIPGVPRSYVEGRSMQDTAQMMRTVEKLCGSR